jgi:hypothetical protein
MTGSAVDGLEGEYGIEMQVHIFCTEQSFTDLVLAALQLTSIRHEPAITQHSSKGAL